VFLAPDGNLQAQFEKLRRAAIPWADAMQTGMLSKSDVWLVLCSTIWRTLVYPLPAINLTCEQCESIMSPILQYFLPTLGICRNFPQKLDLLWYINRKTVHNVIRFFFIELGQIPQLNHIESGYLQLLTTNSLIKSSVIFTSMHNILLQHDIVMTPPRMNDCFIMEAKKE